VGAGLVAVRVRLEGAPESLYCVITDQYQTKYWAGYIGR